VSRFEGNADSIRGYLQSWIRLVEMQPEGTRIAGAPDRLARMVLDNPVRPGRELPDEYPAGEPRSCFDNAFHLALGDDSLTYCEGYATTGFLPVHHAWCLDAGGGVVDNTWVEENFGADHGDPAEYAYMGIPFSTDFVARAVVQKGTYGVLDSPLLWEEADAGA
jgi:hypothetical protein